MPLGMAWHLRQIWRFPTGAGADESASPAACDDMILSTPPLLGALRFAEKTFSALRDAFPVVGVTGPHFVTLELILSF